FKEKGLSLRITRDFYCEKIVAEEEFLEHLGSCTVANLVGEKTIGVCESVEPESANSKRKIAGIPHLQVYKM
ncbi:MAG: DUF424 family protein, partial [Candidatus Altiarchaeota archaeon]|nr:DUF424 family protein [Candidatus Altiarchaeota archaeon]